MQNLQAHLTGGPGQQQMFGDDLRVGTVCRQYVRRPACNRPLGRFEQTVNGRPNDPMRECDRVEPSRALRERVPRPRPSAVRLKPGQLDHVAQGGVVAEHRPRRSQARARLINTGQTTGDAAADRLRAWSLGRRRTDRVRDGHDEKWVSARLAQHGLAGERADSVPRKCVASSASTPFSVSAAGRIVGDVPNSHR